MNRKYISGLLFFAGMCCLQQSYAQKNEASITLRFQYIANDKPLVLADSTYTNAFGEQYTITKLKFYISNPRFIVKEKNNKEASVFLIDAAGDDSISFKAPAGEYSKLMFSIGVDSALNSSGAQAGALDPLNGMFWTWNSGYVYFKMEGYSPSSTADLKRMEYHIGGYMQPNNASREISLALDKTITLNKADHQEILINLNLDKYWQSVNDIKIASNPLIMVPGSLAKKASENFPAMFQIATLH